MQAFRWLIAETLLGWAFDVAPDDEGKIELAIFLNDWVMRQKERTEDGKS